jgi:hypothetical protein
MADNNDEEDRLRPSPDDALEPPDDIYNPRVDQERLEQDNDTPTTPAKPHITTPELPPNHPETDTNIEFQELYDEGVTSATDADAQEEVVEADAPYPLEPESEQESGEESGEETNRQ